MRLVLTNCIFTWYSRNVCRNRNGTGVTTFVDDNVFPFGWILSAIAAASLMRSSLSAYDGGNETKIISDSTIYTINGDLFYSERPKMLWYFLPESECHRNFSHSRETGKWTIENIGWGKTSGDHGVDLCTTAYFNWHWRHTRATFAAYATSQTKWFFVQEPCPGIVA